MKSLRARFYLWLCAWPLLFLLANLKLRPFPHILLIFWTLLPILSLVFSLYFVKKIERSEDISPKRLIYGENGEWTIKLINKSFFMPFFLHFEIPGKGWKKNYITMVLRPGESREFCMPFNLPYTGKYQFSFGEPVYEDLLGFFNLRLPAADKTKTEDCMALPRSKESYEDKYDSVNQISEKGADRKTLQLLSDEIFSIDPLREGESLAHAHWKLSARLQQWMIKNYSDFDREPVRFIINPASVNYDGEAVFGNSFHIDEDIKGQMTDRNKFIDLFYQASLDILNRGQNLDMADKSCNFIHLSSEKQEDRLAYFLADLPYLAKEGGWRLTASYEKKQVIWIQKLDESDLGSLLSSQKQGVSFIIFCFKNNIDPDIIEKLEGSNLDYRYIDVD